MSEVINKELKEILASILLDYITYIQEENKRLNDVKNDLLYVLEQLDGYLDKGWDIDLNFPYIREKYKEDIKEYKIGSDKE